MTQTFEHMHDGVYRVSYGLRPDGLRGITDEELRKEIQIVRDVDLSLLNSENASIPDGILNRAFGDIIVEMQGLDRKIAKENAEGYEKQYAFLRDEYKPAMFTPGVPKERKAGKIQKLEKQVQDANSFKEELKFIIKNADKLPIDATRKHVELMDDREKQHEHYLAMLTHLKKSK